MFSKIVSVDQIEMFVSHGLCLVNLIGLLHLIQKQIDHLN